LTPFYFIRAGSFVSVPVLIAAPLAFVALFLAKMGSKLVGLLPTVRAFGYSGHGGIYYSLMMSTGLTFGTISALFGLNHGIIDQGQYSHLVATVMMRKETWSVGQISGGARWGWVRDHGEIRRPFSAGHIHHQCQRFFSHRGADDTFDGAPPAPPNWRLFLVVGILGGRTTFSSFEGESFQAVRDGARWMGMLYMTGSVCSAISLFWLGALLTARR
jgi:hypothetical protein